MWRNRREKEREEEFETESEEEIDILEEAELILETLEELEAERKSEDKEIILREKEKKEKEKTEERREKEEILDSSQINPTTPNNDDIIANDNNDIIATDNNEVSTILEVERLPDEVTLKRNETQEVVKSLLQNTTKASSFSVVSAVSTLEVDQVQCETAIRMAPISTDLEVTRNKCYFDIGHRQILKTGSAPNSLENSSREVSVSPPGTSFVAFSMGTRNAEMYLDTTIENTDKMTINKESTMVINSSSSASSTDLVSTVDTVSSAKNQCSNHSFTSPPSAVSIDDNDEVDSSNLGSISAPNSASNSERKDSINSYLNSSEKTSNTIMNVGFGITVGKDNNKEDLRLPKTIRVKYSYNDSKAKRNRKLKLKNDEKVEKGELDIIFERLRKKNDEMKNKKENAKMMKNIENDEKEDQNDEKNDRNDEKKDEKNEEKQREDEMMKRVYSQKEKCIIGKKKEKITVKYFKVDYY